MRSGVKPLRTWWWPRRSSPERQGRTRCQKASRLGLLVGIGYAAMITLTTAAFEFSKPRPWTSGFIDASYHVLGLLIAGVMLALWR